MKKIIAIILLMVLVLTFTACADNGNATTETATTEGTATENTTSEISLQEVYDAGKNFSALLGDHESVYVVITSNGKVIREEYLNKQCYYSFSSAEYMDMGFEYAGFTTDHSEYVCFDGDYALNVTLTQSGMVDMKERFDTIGAGLFISSEMLDDDNASVTEEDGVIIVTVSADVDELVIMGDNIVSCVETYTLDAENREITSVKTVYTYEDGTVEEGIATITRDVEAPEGANAFLAYEQETENMRMITIVSNPGTDNEKTESIQAPMGLQVAIFPDWDIEKTLNLYSDAACTQAIEEDLDVNSDLTIYVKWSE